MAEARMWKKNIGVWGREAEQTGCAAKKICLENTVLRVQYLNIHIWGITHLY